MPSSTMQRARPADADAISPGADGAVCPGVVLTAAAGSSTVVVKLIGVGPRPDPTSVKARIAVAGYGRPTEGDRVLVARDGSDHYVVGVLHAAEGLAIVLRDGARALERDGALELRDPNGRLLVRYREGTAEICAPCGDLTLAAPSGRVRVRAATDVEIEAARDVVQRPGRQATTVVANTGHPQLLVDVRRTRIEHERVEVVAKRARLTAGVAALVAESVATKARHVATVAERYDVDAARLYERTKESYRQAQELLQTNAGRVRTVVEQVFSLRSRRTRLVSSEDTAIDGEHLFLG